MTTARFEVFAGKDDQFYFRLRADNGEIVLQSEGYTTRVDAHRGVETVVALVTAQLPVAHV